MYKKVEEWHSEWVALVSDQHLDTLNAELVLLNNHTLVEGEGAAASSRGANASVRL